MAGALIGALRVSLSAETSAFEAGMKRSQRTARTTADSIKGSFGSIRGELGLLKGGIAGFLGALSVGTILAAGKAALDYAGSLGEVSAQIGVTTKDLQVLRYAAGQTGVSQEELETGLSKLTVTLGKVAAGATAPAKALKAIGIEASELAGLDTGEAFRVIADGLAKVEDRSQRAAVEVALFGRSGAKLDTLLAGGSGKINELADAAQRLGIVLSDDQIQRADDTADKLDALQTVLKAQIAGVVADNADSIVGLADAIAQAASAAARAIAPLRNFYQEAQKAWAQAQITAIDQFNQRTMGLGGVLPGAQNRQNNRDAAQRTINQINAQQGKQRYQDFVRDNPFPFNKPKRSGGNIAQFLAPKGGGGGGGGRSRKDNSAEEALRKQLDALRDQNQFDQDILRAKADVLQAQESLARNEDDRANLQLEQLALDRQQYESQLAYEVKINGLTKGAEGISQAQADQLLEHYGITESLKRQKIFFDQDQENLRRVHRLRDVDYDLQREKLELEAGLADTASEQRDVQLRLLDLWYRQERAKLDAIMAEEEIGSVAWEEARQRKAALDANQEIRRENVREGTKGPMEDYLDSLPGTTEKWNEALEEVEVRGLQSLEDGLMSIIDGTKSVGEAFHDMAMSIIQDLIRIAIQKAIVAAISGFANGGQVTDNGTGAIGMAYGGFVSGPGGPKADKIPAMLSNGEFVINAKSTRKFLPLLRMINEGQIAHKKKGGILGGLFGGAFGKGSPFALAGGALFGSKTLRKSGLFGLGPMAFADGGLVRGMSLPRVEITEKVNLSVNDNGGIGRGTINNFDLRGAVVTEDLYRRMEQIGAQAADAGGNLGVKRMRDLNQRTFGRAAR